MLNLQNFSHKIQLMVKSYFLNFEVLEGNTRDTVTLRHRDNTEQERVNINELLKLLKTD